MNKITDIKQQTKKSDRYSVFINEKFAFGVSEFELLKCGLKVGKELSDREIAEIKSELEETKCQEYANNLVCSRLYTEKDLRKKLFSKKFSEGVIMTVTNRLKEYGYIDDAHYAELYIDELKEKYGVYKIRQKLIEKGIADSIISEKLSKIENSDVALSVLRAKLRNSVPEYRDYQKIYRFLAQKGFSFEDSKNALQNYLEELNE